MFIGDIGWYSVFGFGIKVMLTSLKDFGSFPYISCFVFVFVFCFFVFVVVVFFFFWNRLRMSSINSSLNVWYNSLGIHLLALSFCLLGDFFFNGYFHFLAGYGSVHISISFFSKFGGVCVFL